MPQTPLGTLGPVNYAHIVNAGTVQVKNTGGSLMSLNVNGVGTASTATLYDVNQTGTLGTVEVAVFTLGTAEAIPARIPIGPDSAGLKFNNGLVVVTTGTCDLTFGYR